MPDVDRVEQIRSTKIARVDDDGKLRGVALQFDYIYIRSTRVFKSRLKFQFKRFKFSVSSVKVI